MGDPLAFLAGGGEASRMIRERDWRGHPLGRPEGWPPELKAALSLVLNSPESMILAWGPDLSFFFNETYFPLLGPRLPWAMGERFDKVWADGWEQAKPIIDDAFAGRSKRFVDLPWKLGEDRGARDTWWTFSYSRVLDAQGAVAGLFIFTNETTARVLNERELRASQETVRENADRIRLAMEAGAIIGTWFWDIPSDRFTVDEAFATAFGLDPALGRQGIPLAQIVATVHPDDQAGLADAINEAIARGGRYAHQYRVRRRDGRYYWLEANGHVRQAPDGTPLNFPGVLIDVEGRRAEDVRRNALLSLGDKLRELTDTNEMTAEACAILGTTLDVMLVGYGDVDPERETITVQRDWTARGARSLAGTRNFREYGTYIEDFKRGETVIVSDCRTDPRTRENATALEAFSARAFVNAPVYERGAFVALLYVSTADARSWAPAEVAFVQEMASRLRSAAARAKAEAAQAVLNQELSHRIKNMMTLVQAVADQTLRTIPDREPVAAFTKRIHALSSAHDVLLRQSWQSASMLSVVASVLEAFGPFERFDIAGPDVKLGPRTTLSLSLLLHELATNALKYGSLANETGRVGLTWSVEGDGEARQFAVHWRETGGPPASEPKARGFGSRLIRSGLVGTGGVELRYLPHGFEADMTAPLAHVQEA